MINISYIFIIIIIIIIKETVIRMAKEHTKLILK